MRVVSVQTGAGSFSADDMSEKSMVLMTESDSQLILHKREKSTQNDLNLFIQ